MKEVNTFKTQTPLFMLCLILFRIHSICESTKKHSVQVRGYKLQQYIQLTETFKQQQATHLLHGHNDQPDKRQHAHMHANLV